MTVHTRELPAAGGHGVARAYAFITLAQALGAEAKLTGGSTRSTAQHPVTVEVEAPADVFRRLTDLYENVARASEDLAAKRCAEVRKELKERRPDGKGSYEITRAKRGVISGFAQGVAAEIKVEDGHRPAPVQAATHARAVDERSLRAGVRAGREFARKHLHPGAEAEKLSA